MEATLASETLLTSDEAVIAAAAAEAVALARAAVKVAKDAVQIYNNYNSAKIEIRTPASSRTDFSASKWNQFTEKERAGIIGDSMATETGQGEDGTTQCAMKEDDDLEPTNEELELLQDQHSQTIAVRSRRQTERKARRVRAAEKAASSVISLRSGSSSRRKRASLQDVDYSDPLRYLRGTTSTSRLLTAREELELSEGIQVCQCNLNINVSYIL